MFPTQLNDMENHQGAEFWNPLPVAKDRDLILLPNLKMQGDSLVPVGSLSLGICDNEKR